VLGNGTVASLGEAKLNADVRSPETARRHLVMFLSIMPGYSDMKRRSINRMSDVWSNTCEFTQPPLLQGEMKTMGTRMPIPYGPVAYSELPGKTSFVGSTLERPWARDCGTVGEERDRRSRHFHPTQERGGIGVERLGSGAGRETRY